MTHKFNIVICPGLDNREVRCCKAADPQQVEQG